MGYDTKTVDGFEYQIRFATFKPKTFEEAAKAMELTGEDKDDNAAIVKAFENGIESECLVPIVNSLDDIVSLSTGNVYNEAYLVDCFTHGIAIKEQAKSRAILENLARPKKGRINNILYNKLFNKITKDRMAEIMATDNHAQELQLEIERLNDEK